MTELATIQELVPTEAQASEARGITLESIRAGIPEDYLQQRYSDISTLTADIITDIHLNNLISVYGDFTKRVCFKSGAVLEHRSREQISQAFRVFGEEKAVQFLTRENIANSAIHWLYTDADALEQLMRIDPYGYCVYAMSYVLANHSPLAQVVMKHGKKFHFQRKVEPRDPLYGEYKDAEFNWILQKYNLRRKLEQYSLLDIVRVNEGLREYLTVFEAASLPDHWDNFSQLYASDDGMTEYDEILPAAGSDLLRFERVMNRTFIAVTEHHEERGQLHHKTEYAAIYKLRTMYRGYSNFANQEKPRGQSTTDAISSFLKKKLDEAGVHDMALRAMEHAQVIMHKGKVVQVDKGHTISTRIEPGQKVKFNFGKRD